MRVGIITFHHNNNYGAVLQCYGLFAELLRMGHDPVVINYLPPEWDRPPFWRGWGLRSAEPWRAIRRRYHNLRHGYKADRVFDAFRAEWLRLTAPCVSDDEIAAEADGFDAIITGSDQVWVFSRSPHYFLKLTDAYQGKRISYAACCGHDEQTLADYPDVRRYLGAFDSVSVRNEFSRRLIADAVPGPVEVVADPVLLTDFDPLRRSVSSQPERYILLYSMSGDRDGIVTRTIAAARSAYGNRPVVALVANSHPSVWRGADEMVFDAHPGQWINWIANAEFICTDSFHGALFAMKYKRPFMAVSAEGWRGHRLQDVAYRYGWDQALACSAAESARKIQAGPLPYERIAPLVDEHVAVSRSFLERALSV